MGACHPEYMAAVAAGYRKALVNARWAINCSILGSFQSGGALCGQRALTIECSLMSECGYSHELVKDLWKKLWLKFPGLTHIGEVKIQVKKL